MAEFVQLQRSGPDPYSLLTHAVSQYEDAQQRQREERMKGQQLDLQRGQLDLQGKEFASNDAYRSGNLKLGQDTLADQQKKAQAEQFIDLHVKPLFTAGDTAGAAKLVQDFTTAHPDLVPYLAAAAQSRAATPAEEASGNTGRFARTQTGIAASGGTDPNAVNFTTKAATGAFMPNEGFAQQQATDLGARMKAGEPAPNLKGGIPRPSGNSVTDYESRSTGAMTTAPQNQTSQTSITTEGMREAGANKRQAMIIQGQKDLALTKTTGAGNPQVVANYMAAINGAVKNGRDASGILKSIKDPKVAQAVSEELAKPENASLYQAALIPPTARESIAAIDPLIAQARKVQRAYEKHKGENNLFDRDTIDYGLYRAGKKPPDNSPIAEVANTQMLGIQAGARLLKGGSRAYPALKMAMQHAPDGAIDTRANIYDKSGKLITQLVAVLNSELGWDGGSEAPPVGALRSFPNGALGRWDGHGWAEEP